MPFICAATVGAGLGSAVGDGLDDAVGLGLGDGPGASNSLRYVDTSVSAATPRAISPRYSLFSFSVMLAGLMVYIEPSRPLYSITAWAAGERSARR
jgi:hypothetical protein